MKNSGSSSTKSSFSPYKSYNTGVNKQGEKTSQGGEFKKLSFAEISEKKKKDLCFHCDEKFTPGHDCKKNKLYVIIEEENEDECVEEELVVLLEEEMVEAKENEAIISIHAVMGSRGDHTLKIAGQMKKKSAS